MEVVVMLLLVGVVGAMILGPLVRRSQTGAPEAIVRTSAAGGRRAAGVLADLEFDHATGKLADDDYEALRAQVHAETAAPEPPVRAATDRVLDDLEAEIRAARALRRFCTGCEAVMPRAARFCPACGTPVPPHGSPDDFRGPRTTEGRA
ncbi:MAG TPA: zinc ribbon domain-containing protein [bacterium]